MSDYKKEVIIFISSLAVMAVGFGGFILALTYEVMK